LYLKEDACPCCGKKTCTAALPRSVAGTLPRTPYSYREWYQLDDPNPNSVGAARKAKLASLKCTGAPCPNAGKGDEERKSDPPCDVFRVTTKDEGERNFNGISSERKEEIRDKWGVPRSKGRAVPVLFGAGATSKNITAAQGLQAEQHIKI